MTDAGRIAALASPACYPHAPAEVRVLQTHLSIVCLAGDLVYKLKKPVTLPFVDFAPLAARRQACRDEVRLNRRLCPDVYLGTAALRRQDGGVLRFAALGDDDGADDLDVAVVMRRMPQDRMLDELLRRGAVDVDAIAALARQIADFHGRCERPAAAIAQATPGELAGFAADNFAALRQPPLLGLDATLLAAAADASADAFARLLPTLAARAAAGRVVDGHGDLHARNVCMTAPPSIYDCIEFEPRFRIGDVATEIAFLTMDLRHRGAHALAAAFVSAYAAAAQDPAIAALQPTLCSYRAMVRAKVAMLAAADDGLPTADRAGARNSAARHLLLAAACLAEARGPRWLVLCGPPASGKSVLAAELAALAAWPVIATDVVRKELAGVPTDARLPAASYTEAAAAAVYAEVLRRATEATRAGAPVVVLDGNFATPALRAQAAAGAAAAGARTLVGHVAIDRATAIRRAGERSSSGASASDADAMVASARHAAFLAPTATEGIAHATLDGTLTPAELAAQLLAALLPKEP